ncbi:ABC transporter substrate-binding protein [Candidatus Bipolaricaulota bacterium]|nr:ABC transporter substrate-binding protein [Candidatus Bipolaricaulota bacterium]
MRSRIRTPILCCLLAAASLCVAAADDPVVVVDDRGRSIVIARPPQRIVALGALYAQVIVDLEAIDRLIAVADSPDNPPEVKGISSIGPTYAPSVETILSMEPDLVLGATDWGGERSALEAAGIAVLTTPLLTSISDVLSSIRTIGAALGDGVAATDLAGRIAEAIVSSESLVMSLPSVRCAFLYPPSLGTPPYAAGRGTIENDLISRAGGHNVFADVSGFPQVNLEDLLARDPEVIFVAPSQMAYITEDPLLRGVSAVRARRVFGISASRAASTAISEVLMEMIQWLHPE